MPSSPLSLPPRWLWIESARVWDPNATTHLARASEVFEGQAKLLRKKTVWVKEIGIPKVGRKEPHVMELAYLVGDPKEVNTESLTWIEIWVKVSCKDPKHINGTSEVYINKQGYRITWVVADKGPTKPTKAPDDKKEDDGDIINEEEPDSQDTL
uniref:Uncharacterized protein n=1 Tax=Setaria italica TaxID=4555 RepID=K3Y3G3_SETIT